MHTSITDFPTIAFYRQIKGISVRAVKPVTPPVTCARQSNSEEEEMFSPGDKRINEGKRK